MSELITLGAVWSYTDRDGNERDDTFRGRLDRQTAEEALHLIAEYGVDNVSLYLFANDSKNPKAPAFTLRVKGYVKGEKEATPSKKAPPKKTSPRGKYVKKGSLPWA